MMEETVMFTEVSTIVMSDSALDRSSRADQRWAQPTILEDQEGPLWIQGRMGSFIVVRLCYSSGSR